MVTVYSKIKLTDELKKQIVSAINTKVKANYSVEEVTFLIDEHIVSGIRINIDSEVIDLTVNNTLEKVIEILK